jgi:hypothetical protein
MKMHDDDDDDQLSVPAEPGRVIIGLMMMTAGVFIAALIDKSWAKGLGLALFILSPFVMLKSPPERQWLRLTGLLPSECHRRR